MKHNTITATVQKPTLAQSHAVIFSGLPVDEEQRLKKIVKTLPGRGVVTVRDGSVFVEFWTLDESVVNSSVASLQEAFPSVVFNL